MKKLILLVLVLLFASQCSKPHVPRYNEGTELSEETIEQDCPGVTGITWHGECKETPPEQSKEYQQEQEDKQKQENSKQPYEGWESDGRGGWNRPDEYEGNN